MSTVHMLNQLNQYRKKKNLMVGEFYISDNPSLVWTVLGSCVAVVFHCKRLKIGAIVHAQLPEQQKYNQQCSDKCPVKCQKGCNQETIFKYVSCSMNYMLEKFNMLGVKKNEFDVKLFGGANVLNHDRNMKTIGEQNIETALEIVKTYNLNLVSKDLAGGRGRTIYFLTDTGDVYLKHHKSVAHNLKKNLSNRPGSLDIKDFAKTA